MRSYLSPRRYERAPSARNTLRGDPRIPPGGYSACHRGVMGGPVKRTTLTGVTRRSLAVDAGVAALVFGLSLGVLASGGLGIPDQRARALDSLGTLLVAACALPLEACRRAPLTVYLA